MTIDHSARDATIAVNSYTIVQRRPRVPHELFATYWRDVHGPLCARVPGLGWYVQYHLAREQDAHLWPDQAGIARFPDYELDGGVEIGFASAADQRVFNDASSILFADEQNMSPPPSPMRCRKDRPRWSTGSPIPAPTAWKRLIASTSISGSAAPIPRTSWRS